MQRWLKAIAGGNNGFRDLQYDEAAAAAHGIARGESTDAQIAAWLMAERMKGETDDELAAVVDVFRKYCAPIRPFTGSISSAGSSEGRKCFPVTIPVSLLLASVQVPQVLHGQDTNAARDGASVKELLEALGVKVQTDAPAWERVFMGANINFIWVERVCPPLLLVRGIREQIGLRTLLDSVEKVINPVQSVNLIVGVDHRAIMQRFVQLLPRLGFETSFIVEGIEGSEDLPLHRTSAVRKIAAYVDEASAINPETFGFFHGEPLAEIPKERQLALIKRVIAGDDSAEVRNERDHVIFNAGLRLYWFDKVSSYEDGFRLAQSLLQRQEAMKVLNKWIDRSRREDEIREKI